jgi:hypothetical protein
MDARTHLSIAVSFVVALAACQGPKEQPKEPVGSTTITAATRTEAVNATPTGEHGTYQVFLGLERITQIRIVPTKGDAADGRTLDPGHWSYDQAKGRLRVDTPVDDTRETVVVLGAHRRPPEVRLHEDADPSSVRVIVGDHLGVEGTDYSLDRKAGLLRLLGPDTPESPLRYYIQYSLRFDPAHPELAQGVAFGNRGDMDTIRKLLGTEPR